MKKLVRVLGVAAALGFAAVSPANAVITSWTDSYCGGNSFATCLSVEASTDGTFFILEITNDGSNGPGTFASVFAEIGFANLPFDMTGLDHFTGDGNWVYNDNITELNGVVQAGPFSGSEATNPAPQNGLDDGETVTFYFDFTGTFDLTGGILGVHGISGPNECSTKVFTTVGGEPNQPDDGGECGDTVIPEPITMTLLGTGLVGMGGASLLRRRRRDDEIA